MSAPHRQIDTSKPHPARLYDYFLGGKDNYPVDWELAESLPKVMKVGARRNRAFMHRAARWLAAEQGIGQFLDIGTGIPTEPNLHQVVQEIHPPARVLYADDDPIVMRHVQALMIGTKEGTTDYIHADVRKPQVIIDRALQVLDLDRPVALSLIALMHFIPDSDDPYGIIRTLVEALPGGSYVAMTHATADFHPEDAVTATKKYAAGGMTLRPRTHDEFAHFFDQLGLVEPGLVPVDEWRPDAGPVLEKIGVYAGVGRVPDRRAS